MTTGEIQQALFTHIKSTIIGSNPMADEIARLLQISTDSAYRRIRGEKTISLDELQILCTHYHISADELMGLKPGGIVFQGQFIDKATFRFEDYITSVMQQMMYMNSFAEKKFYYLCKDLPIFHHYHIKEIAAFKWFFWLKTYLQIPGFERKIFRFDDHPDEIFTIGKKALEYYNQIPSVEIWNLESMNIILRQIDFYRNSKVFASDQDILVLYNAIENMWEHLEKQASLGYKFSYNDPQQTRLGTYEMYFNEVLLGDNNMLVELDGTMISYVSHSTINFMQTKDPAFNRTLYNHIQNQMRRSTLISEVSEKERVRFFRIIRERIASKKHHLKLKQ